MTNQDEQNIVPNWDEVEREHLFAFRALPLTEKLAAVEEACDLALHFQKRKAIREGKTDRRET